MNQNLYSVLRAGFPEDLDAIAVETDQGANYRWCELESASARSAHFLISLDLAPGARTAVQAEKSVVLVMF